MTTSPKDYLRNFYKMDINFCQTERNIQNTEIDKVASPVRFHGARGVSRAPFGVLLRGPLAAGREKMPLALSARFGPGLCAREGALVRLEIPFAPTIK